MGQRYESKKKSVSENREASETNAENRETLKNEYAFMSELTSMIGELEDESAEAVIAVENVGEQKNAELQEEHKEIEEQKEELSEEITDELDKLNDGLRKMERLGRFEFGKGSVSDARSEYRKQIDKYKELLGDLDVEANIGGQSETGGGNWEQKESDDESKERNQEGPLVAALNFNSPTGGNDGLLGQNQEAHNDNPRRDIGTAFQFADDNYPKESAHWQENANRRLDSINAELNDIESAYSAKNAEMNDAYAQLSSYINENGISPGANDDRYIQLSNEYSQASQQVSELKARRNQLSLEADSLNSQIDPAMRTTFIGRNGSGFEDSYNGIITSPQGEGAIVDSNGTRFGGTCGINETCSIVNMQTGSELDEDYGIKTYTSMNLCVQGKEYESNGGTSAVGRAQFLDAHSLTFQRIEGSYSSGVEINLDDVASRFNNGESIGLMLRAQDLSQPDISSRAAKISWNPLDKSVAEYNASRFNANHATTVAGFSYSSDGSVAGIWINDTGNWAGSNRVYIDRNKFNAMQKKTNGLAFEFSRRR